jgi:hypothetical protein
MLFLLSLTCCYSVHAQKQRRTCDIEPILDSPKGTYTAGDRVSFDLFFKNHGPDKLVNADGILLVVYSVINGESTVMLNQTLQGQGNDSIPLEQLVSYTNGFTLPDLGAEPITMDICVQIFSEAKSTNGDSMLLAYFDPNKSNDLVCNTLTIMPKSGTSVAGADGARMGFLLYPNPTKDKLYIQAEQSNSSGTAAVIIRDITGRVWRTQTYNGDQMNQGPLAIDVAQYPAGLYTISWQTGKEIATKKFTIYK